MLYTGWPCEVLAFRLTNSLSSGRQWHTHANAKCAEYTKPLQRSSKIMWGL